jgi:hypothetical protein
MLFKKIIAVYSGNPKKPINNFCGEKAEFFKIKAGGI